MGHRESLNDPVDAARRHAGRAAALRGTFNAVAALLPSQEARAWLAGHLRGWRAYRDGLVAIHADDRRWSPGQARLLLVTHELSQSGAPRIVLEIARIFAAGGWFVTVASPADGPFLAEMRRHAAVVIDPTILNYGSPMLRRLRAATDLAICNTLVVAGSVLTLAGSVATGWYLHEAGETAASFADDATAVRALDAARWVLAGSELPAMVVRGRRADVRVLPYGIKPLFPAEVQSVGDPVRIGVFGSIESRKGQDLAVAAIAALDPGLRSGLRLTLYGRVLDRAFADRVATLVAAVPEVAWGGELDTDGYASAMAATDVVLVSSREDTLPLVSLDALATGRLLVCTPTTGTSAWLDDGVSGFVTGEAGAAAIADTLARALAQRKAWPTIRQAGVQAFDRVFSERAFAASLLTLADAVDRGASR